MSIPYIAGFIDGEGCITVQQGGFAKRRLADGRIRKYFKGWFPLVSIVNTNKEVIEYIQKLLGGRIYSRLDKRRPNHSSSYALIFTNQQSMLNLLESIYPFLIVKKKQAEIVIKYLRSRLVKNKKMGQAFPYTPEEMNLLKELKQEQQRCSFRAKSFTTIPFSDRTEKESVNFLKNRKRNRKGQFIHLF